MSSSSRPPAPTLLDFLPVTGTLVMLQHATGACLIAATTLAPHSLQVETRLSGDFHTPDEVYEYLDLLSDRLAQHDDIWPLIELSSTAGPALSAIVSHQSGYAWEPVPAPALRQAT